MNVQLTLVGDQVKPWSGVCHKACWFAIEEKCVCRCGGQHHGKGIIKSLIRSDQYKILSPKQSKPFLDALKIKECRWCDHSLKGLPIQYYAPHSGGWIVKVLLEKAWLFIVCPKCRYHWSLWNLGVKRNDV